MNDNKSFAESPYDRAIHFDSLDPRASLDELEPLRELIADARVVAVGESAHYVREFHLLRHRLLRFFAERCGFTTYALEAPFTEAQAIDAWIQGGDGTVEEVAAAGVPFNQGRSREVYDHLEWMRAHNRTAARPLRFAGTTVPGSGGSALPALEQISASLVRADPDALPLVEEAADLVRNYHDTATFKVLGHYAGLDPDVQDRLTAALSRLLCRMETTGSYQARGAPADYANALHHLRGAWYLDHFHETCRAGYLRRAPACSS